MSFTKSRLASLVLGTALLSLGTSAMADEAVNGGTVHFTGKLVNATCSVSADSVNQTVEMGQYRTALFTADNIYSDAVRFQIKLEDCAPATLTTAAVAFNGVAAQEDNEILAVSNIAGGASGSAGGVGIEISDHLGKLVPPTGEQASTPQTLIDGSNVLNFSARYKSIANQTVTAGQADADTTFIMQYQ